MFHKNFTLIFNEILRLFPDIFFFLNESIRMYMQKVTLGFFLYVNRSRKKENVKR